MALEPGLRGTVQLQVAEADTAIAMKSGTVPVLATPRLIALCEEAAVLALGSNLASGTTSVGQRVQIDHVAPSAIGVPVTAEATLEKVAGRRLTFTVSVSDPRGLIAAGRVTVIVDLERFLERSF